jgi:hypothetical protein
MAMLAVPASSAAQTAEAEVTLKVPVNLTQLGPDVSKIRIGCTIRSVAISTGNANGEVTNTQEIPVSGGQVVTTASLAFSFTRLDNPVGKSAFITCSLDGWSAPQQAWIQFTGGATNPSFRISPSLGLIGGAFAW